MAVNIISRIFFILILLMSGFSEAQETSVMIRVKSKDAKFIGSSIGGAKVLVRDHLTGKILSEGLTEGSTGNSDHIMKTAWERGQRLTDDSTAGYNAVLKIEQPTFVTVEAFAPVNKKQALVKSSTQLWVIPGKNITGDGVVLEVPGFVVDILSPQTHERIGEETEISVSANVVMMCGCPVTPGGIWDADNYEIKALIRKSGELITTLKLKATGKESTFSSTTSLSPGNYEITVYAYDQGTGNTGLDKVNILIN